MPETIVLLPFPRRLERSDGHFALQPHKRIALHADNPQDLLPAVKAAQAAIGGELIAGGTDAAVTLAIKPGFDHPEAYRLLINAAGVHITGPTPQAVFYGVQTLIQLHRQFGERLPAVQIEDAPDFPHRGLMIDISRDKVPTMATLYALVDQLAEWKINQLQLYTEHTFAYRTHPEVWAQASPMTGEEYLALDAYCRQRYIELVPNQNSFGHLERWLRLPRYKHLAEAPNGSKLPWGSWWDGPASLNPLDPGSIRLVSELYDELLPHFSSRQFNVGCDETWDLGQGKSKAECDARGKGRVYLDFLLKIHEQVNRRGRTMQFWGDIILHTPELIPELPKNVIALQWGYFATHPYDRDGALFAKAGVPFYVCPGTSSWQAFLSRTDNAIANLKNAAENGIKHGAIGYLNTDWGDLGHHQYFSGSLLTLAAGAGYGWCFGANRDVDLVRAVDVQVFRDRAGVLGRIAFDLGNVYQLAGRILHAASPLFRILVPVPSEPVNPTQGVTRQQLDDCLAAIERIMSPLSDARPDGPDGRLIVDEFRNAAAMMAHACRLGRWHHDQALEDVAALANDLRQILGEHRCLWIARNRIGGLADSAGRLETVLRRYERPAP